MVTSGETEDVSSSRGGLAKLDGGLRGISSWKAREYRIKREKI
jgi:hypothetical protein